MDMLGLTLDSYIVEAVTNKLVVLDKGPGGRFLLLTEAGKNEMTSILNHCIPLLDEGSNYVTDACEEAKVHTGKDYTPVELIRIMLLSMIGSEVRLLAFLMSEKEANYKYITATMKEKVGTKSNLSVVKKKSYDS